MELDDSNFEDVVMNAEIPSLVYFGATWCGPCKVMKPLIDDLELDMGEQFQFAKIDIDESNTTAAKFGIRNIPTMLLIKDGEVVDKKVGAVPKNVLIDWLTENE